MNHKTKLELTWIGKENQPRLEPRILIEDPAKSHHAPFRQSDLPAALAVQAGVKNLDAFPNLTVKKIPKAVLSRCEWGKDDYSVEIGNLPMKPPEAENRQDAKDAKEQPRTKMEQRVQAMGGQPTLFDMDDVKETRA